MSHAPNNPTAPSVGATNEAAGPARALALATGSASLDEGVWYQSFASGGWYRNRNAAGSITAVRVNGREDHAPVCDNCDQQSELDGDLWQCFSEHCRAYWPTILPNKQDQRRESASPPVGTSPNED